MQPDPRRRSRHSRAERSFLPGTCPCKKRILPYSAGCGRRKSATLPSRARGVGRRRWGEPYGANPDGLLRWAGRCGKFVTCALPGESVGRKGAGYPTGKLPPPQSLPLGGRTVRGTVRSGPGEATINHRCPSAHTGSDEGATLYRTFPCRSRKRGLPSVASTDFFFCPVGQPGRPLISHLR